MKRVSRKPPRPNTTFEVAILAGGLSTRMGRNKSQLRLNGRSMLSIIRSTARELRVRVRVVRRDSIPRCGPLGGIATTLKATQADAVLFLACDMPLISAVLLKRLLRAGNPAERAVFCIQQNWVGFPFVLPTAALETVETQIAQRSFSLHELATVLRARKLKLPARSRELFNINTREDKLEAERLLARRRNTRK